MTKTMTKQEYNKAYQLAHKQQLKDKRKIYLENHRQETLGAEKAYRNSPRGKLKRRAQEKSNKCKSRRKAYRESHAAEIKAYRETHKDEIKEYQRKYREAHKK